MQKSKTTVVSVISFISWMGIRNSLETHCSQRCVLWTSNILTHYQGFTP